jgi:hypothetical protein
MQNTAKCKNGHQSRKCGHKVATPPASVVNVSGEIPIRSAQPQKAAAQPATTTHGQSARVRSRIQANTATYYRGRSASTYLIRLKSREGRGWFELGADLDEAVKCAREIMHHISVHGWAHARMKFAFTRTEAASFTVAEYLKIVVEHGQLRRGTLSEYEGRFRQVVAGIAGIQMPDVTKLQADQDKC